MGAMDHQCGFVQEVTYGTTPGAVTRFFEYESESIEEAEGRTEGDPLRVGSAYLPNDRFTPYFAGASGTVQMAVMTKGFGFILRQMLGSVATTGPAETTVYTHTATEGSLLDDAFSMQINRPFHPSGTNQPFLYKGGMVTEWELANSVDGNLLLDLGLDFQQVDTVTALATATYPAGMENLTWAGGLITIGGAAYDIDEITLKGSNGLDTDRRKIRLSTDKKQPTSARREAEFSIKADFDSMTQRNRAHSTTRAGALASLSAKWEGPTLLGTTLKPSLEVVIPAARFDEWKGATEGTEAITQELSGAVRWDRSASPITMIYKSADTTA